MIAGKARAISNLTVSFIGAEVRLPTVGCEDDRALPFNGNTSRVGLAFCGAMAVALGLAQAIIGRAVEAPLTDL